jgi:hypothetical protein
MIKRPLKPHMDITSFYVLVSRAFKRSGLRWLGREDEAIKEIHKKKHSAKLHAWQHGYDINGTWKKEKARSSLTRGRKKTPAPGAAPTAATVQHTAKRRRTNNPSDRSITG